MNQKEFETSLEFRICRELSGMAERKWRKLWCDGITLETMLLNEPRPRILGSAWICQDQHQEAWSLELLLPQHCDSLDGLDWEQLLPAENVTRWLTLRTEKKFIQIDPMAAVPDLQSE